MKPRAVWLRGVFEQCAHCIVIYKNTWIQYLFTTRCFGFALHVHHNKPAQHQCSQCQKVHQEKKGSLGQKTLSDLWCFVDTVKCQRSSEKMPLLPFLLHCYILRILQFITAICCLLTCRCGRVTQWQRGRGKAEPSQEPQHFSCCDWLYSSKFFL